MNGKGVRPKSKANNHGREVLRTDPANLTKILALARDVSSPHHLTSCVLAQAVYPACYKRNWNLEADTQRCILTFLFLSQIVKDNFFFGAVKLTELAKIYTFHRLHNKYRSTIFQGIQNSFYLIKSVKILKVSEPWKHCLGQFRGSDNEYF